MMTTSEKINSFIIANADRQKADFSKKIIDTSFNLYGVPTKKLETFAKSLAKENLNFDEFPLNSHEAILIAGFYLAYSKLPVENIKKDFSKLIQHFDNWSSVDMITCRMAKLINEDDYFLSLLNGTAFEKRVGIIFFMRFKLKTNLKHYLSIILNVDDENYYVKMAKAWSLAESALIDFDYTKQIISSIQDKFIRQKAISKCCDSFRLTKTQKEELKLLR